MKDALHFLQCHMVAAIFLGFALYAFINSDKIFALSPVVAEAEAVGKLLTHATSDHDGERPTVGAPRPEDAMPQSESASSVSSRMTSDHSIEGDVSAQPSQESGDAASVSSHSAASDQLVHPLKEVAPNLSAARRAYWANERQSAIREYQRLAKQFPNSPDVFGELGNVYSQEGEITAAAKAYFKAAELLLARGKHEQARHLSNVLKMLGSEYAETIEKRLPEN